jgi:hypothetical protein
VGHNRCPWTGKERHASRGKALAALRSLTRRGLNNAGGELRVYWHPRCEAWHIGHLVRQQFNPDGTRKEDTSWPSTRLT